MLNLLVILLAMLTAAGNLHLVRRQIRKRQLHFPHVVACLVGDQPVTGKPGVFFRQIRRFDQRLERERLANAVERLLTKAVGVS